MQSPPQSPNDRDGMVTDLRALVAGKNINPETLLATDYLNHFNEVIMLLEMVPDMPECFEDIKAWAPKSYPQHFRDSSFSDKELAILAYEHAPTRYRVPFDSAIEMLNALVVAGIRQTQSCLDSPDALAATLPGLATKLHLLLELANAHIHGRQPIMDQGEIDEIMTSIEAHSAGAPA